MLVFKNNEERCIRIYATNGINATARFTVCDGDSHFMYNDTRYEPIYAVNYSANARQVNTTMRISCTMDVLQFLADSMFSAWCTSMHYGLTVIARNMDTQLVEFLDVTFTPDGNKLVYTIIPMPTMQMNVDQPDSYIDLSGEYTAHIAILGGAYYASKLSTLVLAKMYSNFDDSPKAILTITEDNFSTDILKPLTSEELDTIIKAIK